MATLSLGIVGACGHVHLVLDELYRWEQVRYVACAPSWPQEDISRLTSTGAATVFDDWRDMIARGGLDLVVVAGRYDLGAEISLAALAAGCHVIAEKPAAQNLTDLAKLRQAVVDAGTVYTMMLPLRLEPAFWTAHQVVADGAIGEPLLISGQKSYRWGNRPAWYADRAKYGSTMTWVGIHAFDFARWVSGQDYTWVSAQHANMTHTERPGCQDIATVLAGLGNGGSAMFTMDYLRPEQASSHGDDRLRIAGSQGVLEVTDLGQRLHLINGDGDHLDVSLVTPPATFFGDIIAAITEGHEPLVTSDEALSISAFAIQAAAAADSSQRITL